MCFVLCPMENEKVSKVQREETEDRSGIDMQNLRDAMMHSVNEDTCLVSMKF